MATNEGVVVGTDARPYRNEQPEARSDRMTKLLRDLISDVPLKSVIADAHTLLEEQAPDKRKLRARELVQEVLAEYDRAAERYAPMNSRHEGFGVLLEEVEELWDEVKKNGAAYAVKHEAIQACAMALRFLTDCQ